jgi:antitoxin (DNA-binding transcriptional repressor) of toxin-antitoxin stability system
MTETITVTEAARRFSDMINRVDYQGNTYLLTRGREVVARLTAVDHPTTGAEFAQRWQRRPHLDQTDTARWAVELDERPGSGEPPPGDIWDS